MHKKNAVLIAVFLLLALGGSVAYVLFQRQHATPADTAAQKGTVVAATLAYQQGTVQVKTADSDWQAVETDTILHAGDSLKTGADSKAILELETGDVLRLGYSTEIFLTGLRTDAVSIAQQTGATYNRVAKGLDRVYTVTSGSATAQALGTAFDVMVTDTTMDVGVIESNVKVSTTGTSTNVPEGKAAEVDTAAGSVDVTDIPDEDLTNSWYTWNKEEDSKKTDELGVLETYAGPELAVTNPSKATTTVTVAAFTVRGTAGATAEKVTINGAAAEVTNGAWSKDLTLTPGKNTIAIIAEDANGNKTLKEYKVIFSVQAAATPLKLEGETGEKGVRLSWNKSTGAGLQYYKVVRSATNANLRYPADGYIAKFPLGTEEYTDTTAAATTTYYYRVCEVFAGEAVFCSNVVHLQGKKTETKNANTTAAAAGSGLTLTAEPEDDGVHLEWQVSGVTVKNGFKVVYAKNANPVFPGNEYRFFSDSSVRSYTWALTDGATYHFRVCQYDGKNACLSYSNDVKVTTKQAEDGDVSLVLTAKAEDSGIGLWWTDAAGVAGFKYYKVVRSETNANLKYPDDGYVAVKGKGEESFRDATAVKGKAYYYRICVVGNVTTCSNVAHVTAINSNAAPAAVNVSGTYSDAKLKLTWTASTETDFKYYKVVWSTTKTDPAYPADGYIAVVSSASTTTYTDGGGKTGTRPAATDLTTGTHTYRICVVDQADQVACGNAVTLTNGAIQ